MRQRAKEEKADDAGAQFVRLTGYCTKPASGVTDGMTPRNSMRERQRWKDVPRKN